MDNRNNRSNNQPLSNPTRKLLEEKIAEAEKQLAERREMKVAFERLLSSEEYLYVKRIAMGIQIPYACDPPKTEAEKTKWNTYQDIAWFANKLFSTIEMIATEPVPTIQQLMNGERK